MGSRRPARDQNGRSPIVPTRVVEAAATVFAPFRGKDKPGSNEKFGNLDRV